MLLTIPGGPLRIRSSSLGYFVLFGALVLGACGRGDAGGGSAAEAVPEAERYGGTAVVAGFGDLQSMNSLTASDYNSNMIQREMLFMPLIKYDENINPVP